MTNPSKAGRAPKHARKTAILMMALLAGCMPGTPGVPGLEPPSRQHGAGNLERQVTLRIDPSTGRVALTAPRQTLATIESSMALVFDAANVTQANGSTTFVLTIRNQGVSLSGATLTLGGDRTLLSPTGTLQLGSLPTDSQVAQDVSFANADGTAFTVTLFIRATLQATGGAATDGAPSSPLPSPTASPSSAPTATPSPASSATPTPAPSATVTPPAGDVPNPGANAVRGRLLLNGKPLANYGATTGVELYVIASNWSSKTPVRTDAQGYFTAENLPAGKYFAYYYNQSQRDKIGYWSSLPVATDAQAGGTFPVADLYMVGQQNTPLPASVVKFPVTFQWVLPKVPVTSQRMRLHSQGGRSFSLVWVSNAITDGTQTSFTWDGSNTREPLSYTRDYFWGLEWNVGPLGTMGNLYQRIRFAQ